MAKYDSDKIGTFAGAQGPMQFQSMYPNLQTPSFLGGGSNNQRIGQGFLSQPQQNMPDFLQMAMGRYQGQIPMMPSINPSQMPNQSPISNEGALRATPKPRIF